MYSGDKGERSIGNRENCCNRWNSGNADNRRTPGNGIVFISSLNEKFHVGVYVAMYWAVMVYILLSSHFF